MCQVVSYVRAKGDMQICCGHVSFLLPGACSLTDFGDGVEFHAEGLIVKPSEEFAAKALSSFLKEIGLEVKWEEGEDPPDCVFLVGKERWAVEETQLHQYIQLRGDAVSRLAVDRPLEAMCERIAGTKPRANTDYVVSVFGPVNECLVDIEKAAVEYIRSGETEPRDLDDNGRARIIGLTRPAKVTWMVGIDASVRAGDGKSLGADIRANVQFAVDRIMEAKLPRLRALGGYDKKILIISNGYLFADAECVAVALRNHNLSDGRIDSVLLIGSDGVVHWPADPGCVFKMP